MSALTVITHYEVHWAHANQADKVCALRRTPTRHATREEAEREARTLSPPRADIVTIVCDVRRQALRTRSD